MTKENDRVVRILFYGFPLSISNLRTKNQNFLLMIAFNLLQF